MPVSRDKIEICINLVVIAILFSAFKRLKSRIDTIENNLMILNEVFDHEFERAFTSRRVKNYLKVFDKFF